MSARGKLQLFILVLVALVCVGFMAVAGMTAATASADGGTQGYDSTEYDHNDEWNDDRSVDGDEFEDRASDGDASHTNVNVHATEDVIRVTNRGEQPVVVTIEAIEGDYAGEGDYELQPGETLELPAPSEPSRLRVLAESDDARLEAIVRFEAYEYTCGDVAHRQVAPASVHVEWEAGSRSGSRTHEFERPDAECPVDGTPGGEEPPENHEEAYNETHDRFWEGYENGNETAWNGYEMARALLWGTYEDGRSTFWETYEEVTDDGDDDDGGPDPQDRVNDTRDFGERVANDTRDGAERVANDTQDDAERVANDTQDDVERVREDAEEDRDRVEEDVNETRDDLEPGDDDNESDDGGPDVPPSPPDDIPPEGFPPEDLLPDDVPPEDVPPGDDNGTDGNPVPEGDAVSADVDADAGRNGDTIYAEGGASVGIADGTAHVGVYDRFEAEGDADA